MSIFDEICNEISSQGYDLVTIKPQSFPPNLIFVYLSDMMYTYESNLVVHLSVEDRIDWVEETPNDLEDKIGKICVGIERRLMATIPSAVSTFKFRKPDIIHLGTAYKVSLRCMYTKVIDI